ncbi:MAG: hypothetical protein HDS57_03075 [Barnesiella sp.]|nr:hypothetical protein [Barnesiella sp.]
MFQREERKMKCNKCGAKFTQTVTSGVWKSFSPNKCPECGSHNISPHSDLINLFLDFFK